MSATFILRRPHWPAKLGCEPLWATGGFGPPTAAQPLKVEPSFTSAMAPFALPPTAWVRELGPAMGQGSPPIFTLEPRTSISKMTNQIVASSGRTGFSANASFGSAFIPAFDTIAITGCRARRCTNKQSALERLRLPGRAGITCGPVWSQTSCRNARSLRCPARAAGSSSVRVRPPSRREGRDQDCAYRGVPAASRHAVGVAAR